MTPDEAKAIANEMLAELRKEGVLAVAGASVLRSPLVTTSCTCDGRCTCNGNCSCNSKGDCGCNSMCPCDSKSVPADVQWQIDPDPGATRAIAILNAADSAEEMLTALRNIREGMRVQGQRGGS